MRRLEIELQRPLTLPRIEHRARRSVKCIRRSLQMIAIRAVALESGRIHRTEIRSAIYRVEEPNIGGVEKVERFRNHLQASLLAERKRAPHADVDGAEVVSDKRVARLDAHSVVVSEDVAIRVEAREFCGAHRALNCCGQAEEKVACKRIPALRRRHRSVYDHPVANVIRRQRTLSAEILAVLWNQHEARIRPIIDGLGPGVADAVRKIMS